MAEIESASVFTNGNSGSGDLLQQAFQQVVDEDDQNNEFVAFLQNNVGNSQVIQLTAEQATALGITIKVDDQNSESSIIDDYAGLEKTQPDLTQEESQLIINGLTEGVLLKHNEDGTCTTFHDWSLQQQNKHKNYQQKSFDSSLTLETVENFKQKQQTTIAEETNNIQIQKNILDSVQTQEDKKNIDTQYDENILQNAIQFSISAENKQTNSNAPVPQAQILQRFPVILPSSQFIIKPAQTILTPVKNIRILPNMSKSTTIQTSQNSLLLPKTSLINTISPQLIKSMPIGTQFLSTNNISTQILNNSKLLAKTYDSNTQVIKETLGTVSNINNLPALTQNLIQQSDEKSTPNQIQQKGNLQQFFTPTLKATSKSHISTKTTSLLNNNTIKQNSVTSTIKSIQFPTQVLKTAYVKNPIVSLTTVKNSSTPVIFRSTSLIKSDDQMSTCTTTPIIRTQPNTSVSILKPQAKTMNSILSKQNLANTFLTQKNSIVKQTELSESIKPLVTAKLKQGMNSIMKSIRKKTVSQKPFNLKQEPINLRKPLGSSENPIQIVQQGHTFHSMQRLTQNQLKQIAQVLHQRSQDSSNSNEKVVYRLIFPDEMDLRTKSPTSLLKNRGGKRGRPKKNAIRTVLTNKSAPEEDQDEGKDECKIVARTRSGRLSRPPRHMVRDYKHLHHLDFIHPDLDDSDGGYSDYTSSCSGINGNKIEDEENVQKSELLSGLEMPKRKISDHFRCPTCSKIYLGRTRMARHFEMHPDHGSPDQLLPPTIEADIKHTPSQDPLKRKGKKRGPWAYVTPEAKSERRKVKLQEAISVCEDTEIAKIAGKPVVNSLSLFDLLVLKSENNVRTFLAEIKKLVQRVREKTRTILTVANNEDKLNDDVIDLNEELLCDVLALNSGFYKINETLNVEETDMLRGDSNENFEMEIITEPPLKVQKTEIVLEEGKENIEERLSSGFSESSDLSVSDFLNERRSDPTSINCPEVLSALTLMPRNNSSSPINDVSNVLNTGVEVQTIDNPGFQKLSMSVSSNTNSNFIKDNTFAKLGENLDSNCSDVFTKLNGNYDQTKEDSLQQTFIKLEPTEEGFIKLENGVLRAFHQEFEDFKKIQNNVFHYVTSETSNININKGFRKLIPKVSPITISNDNELKIINDNVSEIDNSVRITDIDTDNTDSNIFGTSDNLDIAKMSYDHITHLDILNNTEVIEKNLIDDKLVQQLVDNSNIVDDLVSERLKSMMPENFLDNNLLHGNGHLDSELDFKELSEEFNRNTRS